jgi:hypothetical protein
MLSIGGETMIRDIETYIDDTLLHKQLVLESGKVLYKYLFEIGEMDLALELLKRCSVHDNSKLNYEEIMSFISIPKDNDGMKNANTQMDEFMKKAISIHWKNNSHHPEYHDNPSNMTELDIMEMACDCYARSFQFGTDLLKFIEIRQKERFNLPLDVYDKYKFYCEILVTQGLKLDKSMQEKIKKLNK